MKYPLMRNNIQQVDLEPVISLLQQKDPKLTSGPSVLEFERRWSDWLGVKYSVFINSGSSANLLALAWLKKEFPEGGRIVLPPFTWSSDISSAIWMDFEIEFVDINLSTLAIDEDRLENVLNSYDDIRAVFLTHAQGINGLTPKIIELCSTNNIHIIEDVCESHGAKLNSGKKAGSHGVISCFSFYYAHHMSTIEGGMLCTNDPSVYQYLRMIRSHGMLRESSDNLIQEQFKNQYPDLNPLFIFTHPGFNVRNNEIGALIGISQLRRLDNMIEKRANNFNYFLSLMPDWVFTDFNLQGQSNYAFNVILNDPDPVLMNRLESTFNNEGIEFRRGSAGGGNQLRQPYVRNLPKFSKIDPSLAAPVADHIHFYGMYLGNYPELAKSDIDYICKVINSI
jgi:CDP-6-deoxy-D-xylo-4-hexulose-3-dehydrase